ncbi:MarC family protein [Chloroflexota bacterium]
MSELIQAFVLTFVPLFIVIDAPGILPCVLSLSDKMTRHQRRKMIHIASLTATLVGLAFLFFGQFILNVMGISMGSFSVSGGIILLVLSIKYMLTGQMVDAIKEELVAVVPIGTPLLSGPATITTLLLLVTQFPLYIVLISVVVYILISWGLFLLGNLVIRLMGQGGLKAVSNVFNLLLAAIAVTMIARGLNLLGIIHVSI